MRLSVIPVQAGIQGVGLATVVFRLAGVSLSFASPKESKQRKGDPWVGVPFGDSLRYSGLAGAAELGPAGLKQSSPFFRQQLRCLALHMGTRKAFQNQP